MALLYSNTVQLLCLCRFSSRPSQQLVVISRGRLRLVAWWRGAVLKEKKNKLLFDSFSPFTVVPPLTHWEAERGPGQQREMKTNKKEENLISGWKLYARQSLPTAQNRTEHNIYRERWIRTIIHSVTTAVSPLVWLAILGRSGEAAPCSRWLWKTER